MRKQIVAASAIIFTSFMAITPAHADLILTLSDGEDSVTTSDFDSDGAVLFVGSVGDWVLNITLGVTDPLIGNENSSSLDLSSLNVTGSSETGGTLTIMLTDTNNMVPIGDTNWMVEFGGTTGGSISFQSYVDSTNAAFGDETLIYDTGSASGPFSGGAGGSISVDGPYSITTIATISHTNGHSLTGFNHGVTIPEPGSLALIGIGLLGLAFGVRRRKIA